MALRQLCDRCENVIDPLGNVVRMRRWKRPHFSGLFRRASKKKSIWSEFAEEIDLCDKCTDEFFSFVKGGTNGKTN